MENDEEYKVCDKIVDSRFLIFLAQITFSMIAMLFGIYLVIKGINRDFGISLIMFVLGYITKNPSLKKNAETIETRQGRGSGIA